MRILIAAGIIAIAGPSSFTAAQAPRKVELALEDQFERKQELASLAGEVVVLVYGDRQGAPGTKEIGERLHLHFHPDAKGLPPAQAAKAAVSPLPGLAQGKRSPDVKVVPVVCLGKMGPALKIVVRGQVKRSAPETPVWLDFGEQVKEQLDLAAGVPNLAVIDAAGNLRHRSVGELNADNFAKLAKFIDQLRTEAAAAQK